MYANVCRKCQTRHPASVPCSKPVERPVPIPIQPVDEDPFRRSGQPIPSKRVSPSKRPVPAPHWNTPGVIQGPRVDWRHPETSPLVDKMDEATRQAFDAAPAPPPRGSTAARLGACKGCYLRDMKITQIQAERDKLRNALEMRRSSDRLRKRALDVKRKAAKYAGRVPPGRKPAVPPEWATPPTPQGGPAPTSPEPVTGGTMPSPPESEKFFGADFSSDGDMSVITEFKDGEVVEVNEMEGGGRSEG